MIEHQFRTTSILSLGFFVIFLYGLEKVKSLFFNPIDIFYGRQRMHSLKNIFQSWLNYQTNLPIVLFQFKDYILIRFGVTSALALLFGTTGFILLFKELGLDNDTIKIFLFSSPLSLIFFSFLLNIILNIDKIYKDIYFLKNISFGYFGGLMGVVISFYWLCYLKDIKFLLLLDGSAILVGFIHSFARTACINYGCCHGREIPNFTEDDLHLKYGNQQSKAVRVSGLSNKPLFPVQVYESLGCFFIAIFITIVSRFFHVLGFLTACYLIFYGILRFSCEYYRGELDTAYWKSLSVYQWISALIFATGIVLLGYSLFLFQPAYISFDYAHLKQLPDFWVYLIFPPLTILFFYGFHYKKIGKWC